MQLDYKDMAIADLQESVSLASMPPAALRELDAMSAEQLRTAAERYWELALRAKKAVREKAAAHSRVEVKCAEVQARARYAAACATRALAHALGSACFACLLACARGRVHACVRVRA